MLSLKFERLIIANTGGPRLEIYPYSHLIGLFKLFLNDFCSIIRVSTVHQYAQYVTNAYRLKVSMETMTVFNECLDLLH